MIEVPLDNTSYLSLRSKGIVGQCSNFGNSSLVHYRNFGMSVAISINPNIKNHITLDLLEMPPYQIATEQDKQKIANERPDFIKEAMFFDSIGRLR